MPFSSLVVTPADPFVGSTVTVQLEVRTDAGAAVDPAGISLVLERPDGSRTTVPKAALANPAIGTWSYAVSADQAGTWAAEWTTATPGTVDSVSFTVAGSAVQQQRFTGQGPCQPWAGREQVLAGWTAPTGLTDELLDLALDAASTTCFELGGRRWPGLCWDRVLPQLHGGWGGPYAVWPTAGGGMGVGPSPLVPSGGDRPGIPAMPTLDLGVEPVVHVEAVRIRGTALAPTAYKVLDGRYLVRVDGSAWPWPVDPAWDPPGIEVDVAYGATPPASGVMAAIALARQLALGLVDDANCSLNRRAQQVIREGVQIDLTVAGLVDNLRAGFTGVPEVDLFVFSVNPNGLRRAARVVVPGSAGVHRLG